MGPRMASEGWQSPFDVGAERHDSWDEGGGVAGATGVSICPLRIISEACSS
jgi:hypothetical protein